MNRPNDIALAFSTHGILPASESRDARRRDRFERLVTDHAVSVRRLAGRLAGSAPDADDLVQETYLRAWQGLGGFRGNGTARGWLLRILLNVFRDGLRRAVRQSALPPVEVPRTDPAETIARREVIERVFRSVERLPRRQREALLLRSRAGLSYAEIAEVMGIRTGAVKAHLVAARRRLLKRLGPEAREWGLERP